MKPLFCKIIGAFCLFIAIPRISYSCTSFFIHANDTMLFGNTMDIDVGDGYVFINKRNVTKTGLWWTDAPTWTSKYASVTPNMWGREFPARGMNEAGLVLGEMNLPETVYPYPDNRLRMELVQWMQYILDNCATIEDVQAAIEVVRIEQDQYESHFLISDARGHSIVIEWLNGNLYSYSYEDLPVAALTNDKYASLLAYYNAGAPPAAGSVSSMARFYNAADLIDNYDPATDGSVLQYAFEILDKVENPGWTKWRLLFDITNRRFYFDTYNHKTMRYIDLDSFDLSCSTPVKMVNLYEVLEGNINGQLIDYSYVINKSHLVSYAAKAGYGAPDWLSTYYDYPASTSCVTTNIDQEEWSLEDHLIIRSIRYANPSLHVFLKPEIKGTLVFNIIDTKGSIVYTSQLIASGSPEVEIILPEDLLSKGTYLLQCSSGSMSDTQKFIVY